MSTAACGDAVRDVAESSLIDPLACDRRMRGVVIRAAAAVLLAAFGAALVASGSTPGELVAEAGAGPRQP